MHRINPIEHTLKAVVACSIWQTNELHDLGYQFVVAEAACDDSVQGREGKTHVWSYTSNLFNV